MSLAHFDFWQEGDKEGKRDATFVIDLADLQDEQQASTAKSAPVSAPMVDDVPHIKPSLPLPPTVGGATVTAPVPAIDTTSDPHAHAFREFQYKEALVDSPRSETDEVPEIKTSEATIVTPAAKAWRQQQEREAKAKEQALLKAQAEAVKAEARKALLKPHAKENLPAPDLKNDATQVVSLNALRQLRHEVTVSERELAEEAAVFEREIEESRVPEERPEAPPPRNNKRIFIIAAVLLLGYALLFPEEAPVKKPKPLVTVDPSIKFPVPFTTKDSAKAGAQANSALAEFAKGSYPTRIRGANLWRESYENDLNLKPSLYAMMRAYGWLLPHSSRVQNDAITMFKLVQSTKLLVATNPDVCLATVLFYRGQGKTEAAFHTLERYIGSRSAMKPALFAAYLEGLLVKDQEAKADQVAQSLGKVADPDIDVRHALIAYERFKRHPERAMELLIRAKERFPDVVSLLVVEGELAVEERKIQELKAVVKRIRELGAENSRLYHGKLLEFQGFLLALENKPREAAVKFREALARTDSESLRDRLTHIKGISSEDNDEVSIFIKQIQARELVAESQVALRQYDFETGLLKALSAQELSSDYIKADLHLAKLQMRMGMTAQALSTLEKLHRANASDPAVNFAMIEAYIDTYKFNDARQLFTALATSELRNDWRYASLHARMFELKNDLAQSILWLQRAINQNPLSDENIYRLAQLLTRAKKFDQAKNRLFQAMELDPTRIEYKTAYAAILYEMDGADEATNYLHGLLEQFPANPGILGEIAIYYHRAGKTQQFLNVQRQIEALPVQDPRVQRFLIRSAMLNEKWDEAMKQTETLLKQEPGDLQAMMEMGRMLMELKRYRDAATWFVRVREKLPTYPRVGYYKARIDVFLGDLPVALSELEKDMKANGTYEEGIILMGDIRLRQEKYPEAEAYYKDALKMNHRSAGALRGMANIALKRGQLDVALDLFRRGMEGEKDNPDAHRQLGEIYRQMGQPSLAIDSYKLYLKLLPDAPDKTQIEQHIRSLE